jgi:methyl-accepting chemotaxis protein
MFCWEEACHRNPFLGFEGGHTGKAWPARKPLKLEVWHCFLLDSSYFWVLSYGDRVLPHSGSALQRQVDLRSAAISTNLSDAAAGVAMSIMIASKIIGPLLGLKSRGNEISRGHLDTPVSFQSNDEVGDLAHSRERMRAS